MQLTNLFVPALTRKRLISFCLTIITLILENKVRPLISKTSDFDRQTITSAAFATDKFHSWQVSQFT